MNSVYRRLTVSAEAVVEGPGLHGGHSTKVRILGGREGLRLTHGSRTIPVSIEHVTDTSRRTKLGDVGTVEHVLSALWGLGVTDAEIVVEGGEVPGADGSAAPFVAALLEAGLEECGHLEVAGPFERIYSTTDSAKIAIAKGEGWWRYQFDVEDSFIGSQVAEFHLTPSCYAAEVAPARTTVFEAEVSRAEANGLGKGLDKDSCLVIGAERYLTEPRFENEPARHKLADLIGDMALTGVPVAHLDVVGERSGHRANIEAAALLASSVVVRRTD